MAERLRFTLTGRDELSRVLNGTADSADRLRLRLSGITADADGQLRDLQGRFLSVDEAQRRLTSTTAGTTDAYGRLREETGKLGHEVKGNLLSLLPAAIPMVAGLAGSAAVLAGQLGAVGVAAGAYALALGPQIGKIGEASDAQKKLDEALRTSGAGSAEAGAAALEYERTLAGLTPETREAAVAVGLLKDNYHEWSDSLSGDVMGPFTKGVAVANALLPKTTGLVKGASGQFDRLITLVAGGISTPGFDRLNSRFTDFTERTLREGIDSLTVFLAKLDAGEYDGGPVGEFMDYAREVGPEVWATLENIGEALLHLLAAGSDVGVGMLDVVNVLTGIVSAVPSDAVATILQLAIAIKAVKLAAAGGAVASAAIGAIGMQIAAMRTSASGTPGALRGVGAAISGLSRTAKVAAAGTGIGLLLIALDALSSSSKRPEPDVDKLTTSLGELGHSGKLGGEAVRAYGKDLAGLADAFQKVTDPQGMDAVQQWVVTLGGLGDWDSTPIKTAKEDIDALDQALAGMVSNGQADLAAAALAHVSDKLKEQGFSADEVKGQLDDYRDALAGQALEQELAAASMGIFGSQAQAVQQKLDAQKQSADGLRASIVALNDVNRSAFDAETRFEEGLDNLSAAFKKNGATLDANTASGRGNRDAMSAAARAHDELLTSGLAAGESLASMTGKSEQLRTKMLDLAKATGMSDQEARDYVDTLLGTPDSIKTDIILERQDAIEGLNSVQAEIKATPDSHTVTVDTLNAAAIAALEAVGLKTRRLPDGRTEVYTANGQALGSIGAVDKALRRLDGNSAHTRVTNTTINEIITRSTTYRSVHDIVGATGGLYTGRGFRRGYADGGLIRGPGTGTSDDVPAPWLSNGEFVIRSTMVDQYGLDLLNAINAGTLPVQVGKAAAPGRPAAVMAATASTPQVPSVTYIVQPRKSVIDAADLRLITRQEEARMRVGRPR